MEEWGLGKCIHTSIGIPLFSREEGFGVLLNLLSNPIRQNYAFQRPLISWFPKWPPFHTPCGMDNELALLILHGEVASLGKEVIEEVSISGKGGKCKCLPGLSCDSLDRARFALSFHLGADWG
jgi:hypothetical protein